MASAMTRGAAKHATNPGARAPVVRRFARISVLAVLAAIATLAALASPASAEDERPVLVIDATGSAEGRAMVSRIEKHLGPDPLLAPVPDLFRLPLATPTTTDTSWKAEEATLAEARKLLTPIGYRQAAAMAHEAQDRLARFADDPAARALIAELALVQGLAVAGERGLDAARPYFLLVHRLTPGRTLDPGRYPPEVVKAFAASAVTGPSGRITIEAPGATEILVDGVVVPGGEPVESHPVPAGPHIITARGEGVVSQGRRIDAIAANTVRVTVPLVEAPLAVRLARARDRLVAAREDGARNIAIRDLLGTIKTASHAIVVVREGDGDTGPLAVRLFTDRGALGPPREVGDDVAGAIAPLRPIKKPPPRGPGGKPGGGGGIGRGPEVPPGEPWYRTSWFKATSGTIAGVALVVVVTAIVTRDPGTSTLLGGGPDVERVE